MYSTGVIQFVGSKPYDIALHLYRDHLHSM